MTQVRTVQVAGLSAISLDNEKVRAVFVPELGGKMVSLVRIASGHEFLLQPQDVGRKYGRPRYGDKMEDFDASGFDECFPTILACKDPLDPNVLLPDHGELWPVPWTARPQDN